MPEGGGKSAAYASPSRRYASLPRHIDTLLLPMSVAAALRWFPSASRVLMLLPMSLYRCGARALASSLPPPRSEAAW